MNLQKAHIISHTHWDREWYLPFEKHRVRLVKLMDELMELLQKDPAYRSFHLDGQTIILDDYLQVRPEKAEQLAAFIREGRIHIGPWYILQDEFLTSSEANVRNLLYGHHDAAKYGVISKLGYFPDSFGNMGQAPQLLRQAGIDTAVFGRGVTPTGFNNTLDHSDAYESPYSEMIWQSPDGSEVLGILFANWYSNGNEVPVSEDMAKPYWDSRLKGAERFASTPHLLFMNGCDHQPVQKDLSEALETARRLYPDVEFVHSSFDEYIAAVRESLPEQLQTIVGELRSQHTDGWGTLVNTASSRIYMKQANQVGQTLLEKAAEPLATWAHLQGGDYPHHLFRHAWKTLMQNHPHDSICGCSIDEVHQDMMSRFNQSRQVTETIIEDSAELLAKAVDTQSFRTFGESSEAVVVFNTTGWERSGTVSVSVDAARIYFREGSDFPEMRKRIKELELGSRTLIDAEGNEVACTVIDKGLRFGYDLPDDLFRQPYFARTVELQFAVSNVPAMGHATYAWVKGGLSKAHKEALPKAHSLMSGERTMENAHVKVSINDDGTFDMTEKTGGRTFTGLGYYENTGDIGNEYMFRQPKDDIALTTLGMEADIALLEDTPYRAAFEITHDWQIPCGADDQLETEREDLIWFTERKAGRSEKMARLVLKTVVSLEKEGKGVHIRSSFNNHAKDHRLRMMFPTDLATDVHYADSIFEIAKRDNEPAERWKNPSNCQHQNAFVSLYDGQSGLTVANKGLNEYEVLRDARTTAAVTVLRAVGELGDWGVFATPEAQCLGEQEAEMFLIPHSGDPVSTGVYSAAYQYQVPWTTAVTDIHTGTLAPNHSWLEWKGEKLALSTMKVAEETGDVVVRWYNMASEGDMLQLKPAFGVADARRSDILERRLASVELSEGTAQLPLGNCEIITLSLSK